MKHLRILGLFAVSASALMAFAATASADLLTSPTGTTYTGKFTAEAATHSVIDNPVGLIECFSKAEGSVSAHGAGKTVSVTITSLTFGSPVGTCTNGWHVTVVSGGTLSIHGVAGSYKGDIFSSGATIEATNPALGNLACRYSTNNTTIGVLTGGTPAEIDISGSMPFHSGGIFCGTGTTPWTGAYVVKTPSALLVDTT